MSVLERGGDRRPRLDLTQSPVSGGLANAAAFSQESAAASGPSVRHYDRSGVACPWGWELSRAALRGGATEALSRRGALSGRVPVEARDAVGP